MGFITAISRAIVAGDPLLLPSGVILDRRVIICGACSGTVSRHIDIA